MRYSRVRAISNSNWILFHHLSIILNIYTGLYNMFLLLYKAEILWRNGRKCAYAFDHLKELMQLVIEKEKSIHLCILTLSCSGEPPLTSLLCPKKTPKQTHKQNLNQTYKKTPKQNIDTILTRQIFQRSTTSSKCDTGPIDSHVLPVWAYKQFGQLLKAVWSLWIL